MAKYTVEKQEELFAKNCKIINLQYEYNGYIGLEKWAIVSDLTEEELQKNIPILSTDMPRLSGSRLPKVSLSTSQIETMKNMRNERRGPMMHTVMKMTYPNIFIES